MAKLKMKPGRLSLSLWFLNFIRKNKNHMPFVPTLKYFARKTDGSKNVGPFDDPNDVVTWIQNQGRESTHYTVETLESAA